MEQLDFGLRRIYLSKNYFPVRQKNEAYDKVFLDIYVPNVGWLWEITLPRARKKCMANSLVCRVSQKVHNKEWVCRVQKKRTANIKFVVHFFFVMRFGGITRHKVSYARQKSVFPRCVSIIGYYPRVGGIIGKGLPHSTREGNYAAGGQCHLVCSYRPSFYCHELSASSKGFRSRLIARDSDATTKNRRGSCHGTPRWVYAVSEKWLFFHQENMFSYKGVHFY